MELPLQEGSSAMQYNAYRIVTKSFQNPIEKHENKGTKLPKDPLFTPLKTLLFHSPYKTHNITLTPAHQHTIRKQSFSPKGRLRRNSSITA